MNKSLKPLTEAGPLEDRLAEVQSTVEGIWGSSDFHPLVELRHAKDNRKVRADSNQAYDLEQIVIQVSFQRRQADFDEVGRLFVEALSQVESTRPFVSLKWFRDTYLPEELGGVFSRPETRSQTLTELIEGGLVTVGSVPHPDPAKPYSTTTINLNHRHRSVRAILDQPNAVPARGSGSRFRPRRLKGEPLSKTVLDERR
ncbi:MAG: hypothetical protein AB7S38_24955 [Vulcanimicrobiota bacterium]